MLTLDQQWGFTLLEVLIALVIISLALLAGLSTTQSTTHHLQQVQDRTFAYWVAQNALIQMRLKIDGTRPVAGRWQAQARLAERVWHWQALSTSTAHPQIKQLLVTVSRSEDEPPLLTLVNYWPINLISE